MCIGRMYANSGSSPRADIQSAVLREHEYVGACRRNVPNSSDSVPKRKDTVMFSFTPFPKPYTDFSCLCKQSNIAFRQSANVWSRMGHNLTRLTARNVPKKRTSAKQFIFVCVYVRWR